jgi:hypothetical protein
MSMSTEQKSNDDLENIQKSKSMEESRYKHSLQKTLRYIDFIQKKKDFSKNFRIIFLCPEPLRVDGWVWISPSLTPTQPHPQDSNWIDCSK